jgi:hypothetical protein
MDPQKKGWIEQRCTRAAEKLKAHGFETIYVKTKEEAAEEIMKHVTPNARVGAGGSITIRSLGILEKIKATGHTVFDHWAPGLSEEQSLEIRKAQMTCDLFLSSSNAVTMNGELVNVDGIGNRVNAINFGPGKVILVAGYNKIVGDVSDGIKRVKNEASPPNTRRLGYDLPCAKTGVCSDCNSPSRACRVIMIHERKPFFTDILVVLVGEELGY